MLKSHLINKKIASNNVAIMSNLNNISNLQDDITDLNSIPKVVACGKVSTTGTLISSYGISSVNYDSGTNIYKCNLSSPRPNNNYVINLTLHEYYAQRDSVIIVVNNNSVSTTSFEYMIYNNDNGGSGGALTQDTHHILVFDY